MSYCKGGRGQRYLTQVTQRETYLKYSYIILTIFHGKCYKYKNAHIALRTHVYKRVFICHGCQVKESCWKLIEAFAWTHRHMQRQRERMNLKQAQRDRKIQTDRIASHRHTVREPRRLWACHRQNTAWIFSSQIKITKYKTKKKRKMVRVKEKDRIYSWKHQRDKPSLLATCSLYFLPSPIPPKKKRKICFT